MLGRQLGKLGKEDYLVDVFASFPTMQSSHLMAACRSGQVQIIMLTDTALNFSQDDLARPTDFPVVILSGEPDLWDSHVPDLPDTPASRTVSRFGSIREVDHMIRGLLDEVRNGQMQGTGDQNILEQKPELGLVFSFQSGRHRDWAGNYLNRQLAAGRLVYYLPLMPTYQMFLSSTPGKGPNLSDLLLRIAGSCPPDMDELSHYLQPHDSGYLQFRPPDRADDVLTCDMDILRQLVYLLREKIFHDHECASALIECSGLSLETIGRLCMLCDFLAVDVPDDDSFAGINARKELGYLLSKLPLACRVEEMPATRKVQPEQNPLPIPAVRTEWLKSALSTGFPVSCAGEPT